MLGSGIIKKVLHESKIRKKKHNKLLYLAKNKLDCVEILVIQGIIDHIISHDQFKTIVNEKKDYDIQKNTINEGEKSKISEIEINLKLSLKNIIFFFLSIINMSLLQKKHGKEVV